MKNGKSLLLLIPFLILAAPLAFMAKVFEKSMYRSRDEVEAILVKMALNQPDEYLWDDFLSIPIKDKDLDNIREQVEILWAYDSFQTKNENGQYILNQKGLDELENIIQELRFGRT